MGSLGTPEIIVIFVVALIVLGPERLPNIAKQLGKSMGEFRRMSKAAGPIEALSEREREVLQYVARGHTYREIGEELHISPKTVENHVRNILGKLHLSRRAELIRWAADHGIG